MYRKIIFIAIALTFGATTAHSMSSSPGGDTAGLLTHSLDGSVHLTGAKKFKRAFRKNRRAGSRTQKFAGNGGGVKDTCPGGDHGCINDLKAACDKAGGGLSTEPDGGVDCFVVGIHDQ